MPSLEQTIRLALNLGKGDPVVGEQLVPLVYDELRELAARYMGRARPAFLERERGGEAALGQGFDLGGSGVPPKARPRAAMPKRIASYRIVDVLDRIGKHDLAEKSFVAAYERCAQTRGKNDRRTVDAIRRLIKFYESRSKPELVAQFTARLDRAEGDGDSGDP